MANVKWHINGCIRTFFHFLPGFNNVFYVKQLILRLSGIKNIKLLKSKVTIISKPLHKKMKFSIKGFFRPKPQFPANLVTLVYFVMNKSICIANQLIGFYMMAAFNFNGLKADKIHRIEFIKDWIFGRSKIPWAKAMQIMKYETEMKIQKSWNFIALIPSSIFRYHLI